MFWQMSFCSQKCMYYVTSVKIVSILPIKCKVESMRFHFFILKIKVSIFFFWEIPVPYLQVFWRYICRLIKGLSSTSSKRFLSLFLQQVMSLFSVLESVQTLWQSYCSVASRLRLSKSSITIIFFSLEAQSWTEAWLWS